jgi:hypothetical protein
MFDTNIGIQGIKNKAVIPKEIIIFFTKAQTFVPLFNRLKINKDRNKDDMYKR